MTVGCSSTATATKAGHSTTATASGGTRAALVAAASAYSKLTLLGTESSFEGSWRYLDARCRATWHDASTWAEQGMATDAAAKAAGLDLTKYRLGSVTIASFTPRSAQVVVTSTAIDPSERDPLGGPAPSGPPSTWRFENGHWMMDYCPATGG
jgi:hypothetical protein